MRDIEKTLTTPKNELPCLLTYIKYKLIYYVKYNILKKTLPAPVILYLPLSGDQKHFAFTSYAWLFKRNQCFNFATIQK